MSDDLSLHAPDPTAPPAPAPTEQAPPPETVLSDGPTPSSGPTSAELEFDAPTEAELEAALAEPADAAEATEAEPPIVDDGQYRWSPPERFQPADRRSDLKTDEPAPILERLQKVLSAAGVASRRASEELILQGRVEVDRKPVTELGAKVDIHRQEIRVDGEVIRPPRRVYFAVYKPVGVVTTNSDPAGRPRVIDLVPTVRDHLFAVGRLDLSSEGLILVTNDGDLANRLAHPRYGVRKTYLAQVLGHPSRELLDKLVQGVHLAEGWAHCVSVRIVKAQPKHCLLEMVLDEGRNREIRRILARLGHKVLRLKRIAVGPVRLADMRSGEVRRLTLDEVDALLRLTSDDPGPQRGPRPSRPDRSGAFRPASGRPGSYGQAPGRPGRRAAVGRTRFAKPARPKPLGSRVRKGKRPPLAGPGGGSSYEPPIVPGGTGAGYSLGRLPPDVFVERTGEARPPSPGAPPSGGRPPGRGLKSKKPRPPMGARPPMAARPPMPPPPAQAGQGGPPVGRPEGGPPPVGGRPPFVPRRFGARPGGPRPGGPRPGGPRPGGGRSGARLGGGPPGGGPRPGGGRPGGGRPGGGRPGGGRPGGPRPGGPRRPGRRP